MYVNAEDRKKELLEQNRVSDGMMFVLFFLAKTVFVELKAPGKQLRPLQRKRRYQLMKLGFPVLCIDRFSQIKPCIQAILHWTPGEPFPEGIGAKVPELEVATLPSEGEMDTWMMV